ncbi:MAG: DUF4239 domain-containing protein [Candidatus Eremiobacteraeota bacterium]|nr:DUF4239 domain-containing protein [Candidatus Eremiobacteraeota bacterium]
MLNQWFYSHNNVEVALLVCGALIAIALVGLWIFTRLVNWEERERDTSMIGLSYAFAGAVYAVVLAFVAVGVYETMDGASAVATAEANSLSSLVFDSTGLPAKAGLQLRKDALAYVDIVVKSEWPSQQAYDMDDRNFVAGWKQLQKINLELSTIAPANESQAVDKNELLGTVNDLFAARRSRILAAGSHLPDAVWQMLLAGLVVIAIYLYLFGPHNYRVHVAVTGLTVLSIALVFTLIVALDYPFRGDLSVSDEAFVSVQATAQHLFGGQAR